MSYLSYKPQVRQEGFHLPNQNRQPSPPQMDPTSMFMLPDAFRKFPAVGMGNEHGLGFDFSDELSQLMAGPNAQSMQQPHTPNYDHRQQPSFDDSYRHTTHNIFDISAPLSTSHHNGMSGSLPTPASSLASSSSHYPSSFALQTNRHHNEMGMLSPPNSLQQQAGPLAEFTKPPSMFNSTLPALNSSMRFEPPPIPAAPEPVPQHQAAFQLPPDFRQQHTPSPSATQPNIANNPVSRSRSRTRAPSNGPGPTRTQSTTRAKRNSVSSSSPPPRPHPSAILIPGATGLGRAQSRDIATSPLALTTGGWFAPEFGLPTPDSMNSHGFNLGRDGSLGPPSAVDEPSPNGGNMSDAAAKQAAIANEKRRRRRESHNAVERRRRDNINEKIGELATLIPECMLDANAPANFMPTEDQITGVTPMPAAQPKAEDTVAVDPSPTPTGASATGGVVDETAAAKANKGMILRKSVDYIRYLQQLVGAQASRNRVLESELATYRARDGSVGAPVDASSSDDFGDLVLHDSMNFSIDGPFAFTSTSFDSSLAPVHEIEMDDESERPDTGMTGPGSSVEGQSPSVDGSDEFEDEPRGRRDRNGRLVDGMNILPVQIKTEGSE